MRKILAIEKNSWKNLWKVRNILSIACNVSLDKMPKEVKKERRVLTREEQEKFFTFASSYIHINVLKFAVTTGCRIGDDDDKIRLNQRKPSKYKGLSRFGPEKNLQRINKFMKE